MIICNIFDNSGNFISRIGGANGIPTSIKRVPIAELPTNTPSPSFVMGVKSKSTGCETSSSSCSGGLTVNRNELIDHSSSARTIDAPLENDHVLDSYKTPMKQLEGFNLIDSVSVSSTLDDDFDESILEEIDALCEQNSAAKAEMQVSNGDIHTGSNHNSNSTGDLSAVLESVTGCESVKPEGTLDSVSNLDLITKGPDTSQTIQTGNMPEEYSKYLQSLNDRQREAACNNISVPLMIVAGPGSGKVPLFIVVVHIHKKLMFLIPFW